MVSIEKAYKDSILVEYFDDKIIRMKIDDFMKRIESKDWIKRSTGKGAYLPIDKLNGRWWDINGGLEQETVDILKDYKNTLVDISVKFAKGSESQVPAYEWTFNIHGRELSGVTTSITMYDMR